MYTLHVLYIHKSILMYFTGISFSFLSPLHSVIQRVHSAGNMLSTEEKSNSKGKSGGHKLSALYEPFGGGEGERERDCTVHVHVYVNCVLFSGFLGHLLYLKFCVKIFIIKIHILFRSN